MRKFLTLCLVTFLFPSTLLLAADDPPLTFPVSIVGDTLLVEFPYADYITKEDLNSLLSGEEITIVCRLELWQKRKFWFDRLRMTDADYFSMKYDRWQEKYFLSYIDDYGWSVSKQFDCFGSLIKFLASSRKFKFKLELEDFIRQSFLAYAIDIKYLTPEKLDELSRWLTGGNKNKPSEDKKVEDNSFPGKIVELILKSAGFKNRSQKRASLVFIPDSLNLKIIF